MFRAASDGNLYVVHKSHKVSLVISSFGDWILVDIDDVGHRQHVYYDGKWAEIVFRPKVSEEITANESDFPIISTKRIINFSQLT